MKGGGDDQMNKILRRIKSYVLIVLLMVFIWPITFGSPALVHGWGRNMYDGRLSYHRMTISQPQENDQGQDYLNRISRKNWLRDDRVLFARLSGEKEVPGSGDPEGQGWSVMWLRPNRGLVCYSLMVNGIALPASGAHIHKGDFEESGPVVVNLTSPDEDGVAWDCSTASNEVLTAIQEDPDEYYVNVHNGDYPDGAVRGQLSRW